MDNNQERQDREIALSRETWRLFRILSEFVDGFDVMSEIGAGITVFGSARTKPGEKYYDLAVDCGKKICDKHFAVITGGGPGIMARDANLQTPLHYAARAGFTDVVADLAAAAANHRDGPAACLNALDRWKRTPVHWAVLNSHPETLQVRTHDQCAWPELRCAAASRVATRCV